MNKNFKMELVEGYNRCLKKLCSYEDLHSVLKVNCQNIKFGFVLF